MKLIAVIMLLATCAIAAPPQAFLSMWRAAKSDVVAMPTDGLRAWWEFTTNGATAAAGDYRDSSGNEYKFNDIAPGTRTTNGLLRLTAAGLVFVGIDSTLGISNFPFSTSAWVNHLGFSASGNFITDFGSSTNATINYSMYNANTNGNHGLFWRTVSSGNRTSSPTTPVATNTWNHFVSVWETNAYRFYKNGELISTSTNTIVFSANRFAVGVAYDSTPSGGFDGWVDNVRVYNRVLTQDEIDILGTEGYDEIP